MGSKTLDYGSPLGGIVDGEKRNRCVVPSANVPILAHSLERQKQNWIPKANSATDLIIQVGDSSFCLHKLAMVSRSEYLNRLVSQRVSNRESLNIQINNLPGGTKAFQLVVKFCYGWKIDITASNIASLYCAAHFLEMSEDLEKGNLISKTEAFLSFLILSSWKHTFQILKTCESISPWAKDLQIVKRCSESIAWKACANPNKGHLNVQASKSNKTNNSSGLENKADTWWFEDVSLLRIDHFIEVIQSIKKCGIKPELVGSCIEHWTRKWFSQVTLGIDKVTPKQITLLQLQRFSTECLIKMLPTEENSVTCNFLLHLLKAGVMLKINPELMCVVERRAALILEKCKVSDLLVENEGDKDSLYDVSVVLRVLRFYVCGMSSNSSAKLYNVGKLLDRYLTQVARDENLTVESFKSLVEALPQNARCCDDNLYRAIDMYLKAHPDLEEEDRGDLCRVLQYHRLSQEARQHVIKNDRLPLKLTTEFVLLEQGNMARSMASNVSNYRRPNTQTIRVNKDFGKREINVHEINMIRKDVEMIKSQLVELHSCKVKIQKQLKSCIR